MEENEKATRIETIQGLIDWGKKNDPEFNENELSDGYHTFDELYEFRKMYNAALFNQWAQQSALEIDREEAYRVEGFDIPTWTPKYNVHKSRLHHDGELCFGDKKWFIVSAMLPTGLISNHYKMEDWDLFKVPEVDKALYEFDGHTGKDVLERLRDICK